MAKVKTSELIGAALDWAVANCEGRGIDLDDPSDPWLTLDGIADQPLHRYTPSTDWSQGGPIIERERICITPDSNFELRGGRWSSVDWGGNIVEFGITPLISAMRCYVASKLGDVVNVPDKLL